jgi:hypothetical protein
VRFDPSESPQSAPEPEMILLDDDYQEPVVETPNRSQKRKLILPVQESAMEGEGIFPDSGILSPKKKFRGRTIQEPDDK